MAFGLASFNNKSGHKLYGANTRKAVRARAVFDSAIASERITAGTAEVIARPEKPFVNLLGTKQVFKLLQAGKGAVNEDIGRHVDPFEQFVELFRPSSHIPGALKVRQMSADLFEGHSIAAIVRAG